jgi:hypothetical protein
MESRIDNLEKMFQSNMTVMKGDNDALQKELASLRQKELQQDQENKQLRERLARAEAKIQGNINNDLTNDSDGDRDSDDNNDTNDISVMEGNIYALPEEPVALKQKEFEHQEENQGQKERLTRMEAGIEDDANNDLNYDSFDEDDDKNATSNVDVKKIYDDDLQKGLADLKQRDLDHQKEKQRLKERLAIMEEVMQNNAANDLNYDSSDNESNDNSATNNVDVKKKDEYVLQEERAALKQKELEQHEENKLLKERLAKIVAGVQDDPSIDPYHNSSDNEDDDKNNTTANTQQRESQYHSVEIYADPNYDSSDNEDPRNNSYFD